MKGEQIGSKVREIKFPQYIMNEKFEKNKNKILCFYFEDLIILFDFLVYFF